MKHVRVRLDADGREGEIHPMYDVLSNAPFVERATALQWNYTGIELSIFHYVEGDLDRFVAVVSDIPAVLGFEVEPAGDDAFYAYVRGSATDEIREMFRPLGMDGLVAVPPILYHEDGTVTFSLFGPEEALTTVIEGGPDPLDVTVEAVGGLGAVEAAIETSLSDRQREAIEAARELGYYEVPREANHEEVADALDCAPSTAAEHLRKAESKLLGNAVL